MYYKFKRLASFYKTGSWATIMKSSIKMGVGILGPCSTENSMEKESYMEMDTNLKVHGAMGKLMDLESSPVIMEQLKWGYINQGLKDMVLARIIM